MQSLDAFSEKSIGDDLLVAIRNKVLKILEPQSSGRRSLKSNQGRQCPFPQNERSIASGIELLAQRASIICNKEFGRALRKRGVDQTVATELWLPRCQPNGPRFGGD
jgi:hypothetical protein